MERRLESRFGRRIVCGERKVSLLLDYPGEHEVALYQSARLATERFRAERLALRSLAQHHDAEFSAVVVPPCPAHPADLTAKLLQSAGIRSG